MRMDNWDDYKNEVKSAISLRETIEQATGARFQKTSNGFRARCPFHSEKTPSFFVREDRGTYRCFGTGCGASGDVFQFMEAWHGLGFREALIRVGELAGLHPPSENRSGKPWKQPAAGSAWASTLPSPVMRKRILLPSRETLLPSSTALKPIPPHVRIPKANSPVEVFDPEKRRTLRVYPSRIHEYRSVDGEISLLILRVDKPDGGKFFIQTAWAADNLPDSTSGRWELVRISRDTARPIYGLESLKDWSRRPVGNLLFVEGEKTRDAIDSLLPAETSGLASLSNMGGGNAVGLADWGPVISAVHELKECGIFIWPDADRPIEKPDGNAHDRQLQFVNALAGSFIAAAKRCNTDILDFPIWRIQPPEGVKHGWDLADAVAEGWSANGVLNWMEARSVPLNPGSARFSDNQLARALERIEVGGRGIELDGPPCPGVGRDWSERENAFHLELDL